MPTQHTLTLQEIADRLYAAGMMEEYAAIKGYMVERSGIFTLLERIEIWGHDAGDPIEL